MERDTSINDILREVVTFLECLGDAQLPLTLESLREKLLARSKNTLSVITPREASSPEPYLDMKSGPKSLLLTRSEAQINLEEYVGMEESQKHSRTSSRPHSQQDYYETFENESQAVENALPADQRNDNDDDDDDDDGQRLIGIYKNLPAMQIRTKCHKCGPLYRKEGKKLFLSESLNACWIALVGSHLLIYRSERHARPYAIYPIRGYMARPAPTMILRSSDRRKSDAAFEIYSPGNETLQLIARTPKDMEQWIAKIGEVGCSNHSNQRKAEDRFEKKKKKKKRRVVVESSPTTCRDDDDDDDEAATKSTVKAKSMSNNNNNKRKIGRKDASGKAPPLPARIPRRLPSLPPASPLTKRPSYKGTVDGNDNDDNDDIYHRIEDLRNEMRYQNMVLSKKERVDPEADDERRQEEAYDDVREARMEEETRSLEEIYDDVVALSRINATSFELERNRANAASVVIEHGEQGEEEFYDDVANLIANSGFAGDDVKNQPQVSNKLEKKSFLDKVLSRRDSPGKSGTHKNGGRHRSKSKVWSNPSSAFDSTMVEQVPTYDDVSDLTPSQKEDISTDGGEELPEYNCPPPPRAIYQVNAPAPAENQSPEQTEEFYDDVSAYQEPRRNKDQPNHQQVDTRARAKEAGQMERATCNADDNTRNCRDGEDTEHYQSPRSAEMGEKELVYDDIALLADFTARQRDIVGKKESEDAKSVSCEKKAWNRFAVNRKSRATSELNCSNCSNCSTAETRSEVGDEVEASKKNTFQKLISRMENSLAKVSARSPSSLSTGKPSASSNGS